jgi:hypothetical protein
MELLLILILIAVGGLPLLIYAAAGMLAVAIVPTAFVLLLLFLGWLWSAFTGALEPLGSILEPLAPSQGVAAFVAIVSFYGLIIWSGIHRSFAKAPTAPAPIQPARPQSLPRWAQGPSAKTACK